MKFRQIDFLWAIAIMAIIGGLSAYSPNGNTTTVTIEDGDGMTHTEFVAASGPLQKIYPLDTLSAAGTTYITLPWNMASAYQYQYFFKMRKMVGTPNVKIRLEERNTANSAIWSAIDSVSVSGADSTKLFFRLRGSIAYGAFHRIAFVKTGTNTMARNVELNIKPTN